MSEDRNNGIGDKAVSDAYRDVATERAPASLNEAVLHDAAAHASKGYAHSMRWMRPLAYAATVVLSLAIVIQVVLPTNNLDVERPASAVSPAADAGQPMLNPSLGLPGAGEREQAADDDDPLKRLRDQEVREESKIEEFEVPAVSAEAGPGYADHQGRLDADDRQAGLEEAVVQRNRLSQPEADSFQAAAMRSEASIQQASDMAAASAVQMEDYNASAAPAAPGEVSACEPEDIESPEAWADCIDRLEADGRIEEANRERTRLSEAFPDFEWPAGR